jgi:2-dehydro-3-deoxyphosphogluconate aldolase/(4S)-4-hydroxy-2-oxoglutarate aldolase
MSAAMHVSEIMTMAPVIPVLVVEDLADAAPLARALAAGGLRVLEVTLRTPAALDAISAMAEAAPDAIVGAGTVLNPDDLKRARDAGARFIVSPGLTPALAHAAEEARIPLLPGVATCGEIMGGLDLGLDHFKFFPAENVGGAAALKSIAGPFPQVRFCPTGGVTPASAPQYLALPNVLCVGGSWVAPKDAVAAADWTRIEALAREAAALGLPGEG